MRDSMRSRSTNCTPHPTSTHNNPACVPEREWTELLKPSERRELRVAAAGYLHGLLTREEIKATINAARMVALSREAMELRGGVL